MDLLNIGIKSSRLHEAIFEYEMVDGARFSKHILIKVKSTGGIKVLEEKAKHLLSLILKQPLLLEDLIGGSWIETGICPAVQLKFYSTGSPKTPRVNVSRLNEIFTSEKMSVFSVSYKGGVLEVHIECDNP